MRIEDFQFIEFGSEAPQPAKGEPVARWSGPLPHNFEGNLAVFFNMWLDIGETQKLVLHVGRLDSQGKEDPKIVQLLPQQVAPTHYKVIAPITREITEYGVWGAELRDANLKMLLAQTRLEVAHP